jgi:GT2 family glycosyltransferase
VTDDPIVPVVAGTGAVPLLTDDLVIAATDRQREPELPAATVREALVAPLPTEVARYDLILLPAEERAGDADWASALAAGFARAGHRVFRLVSGADRPTAPGIVDVPIRPPVAAPVGGPATDRPGRLLDALARLRDDEGIEAAALCVPDPAAAEPAREARTRWGWRLVMPNTDRDDGAGRAEPDIVIADADDWRSVDAAVRAAFPKASVVVVTFDNLAFTRLCLTSVLANTEYPDYELIVVDNGSTDGTVDHLRALAERQPHLRVLVNAENRGFSPAYNQGLAVARGELLVLLNNDTMAPRGWLTRLARHLEDPALGLVGPATNRIGNEAQVEAPYRTYGDFLRFARTRAAAHDGERLPIRVAMMFCAALRRDVFERVGPLDERYAVGMFEDEDYALRVKAAGYAVAWAPDAFVHHAYHASIGKLLPSGDYTALFKANQRRFEEKWGICWERHRPPT